MQCSKINCKAVECTWEPYRLVLAKCDCVKASKCTDPVAAGQDIYIGEFLKKVAGELALWDASVDAPAEIVGVSYGRADTTAVDYNPECVGLCYFYRDAHLDCAGINWQGMTNAEAKVIIDELDLRLRISIHDSIG